MQISVTMALDSLREQVDAVDEAKETYERLMAERDDLIRAAVDANVSRKQLIRITRLSRERLYAIANSPSKTYHRT